MMKTSKNRRRAPYRTFAEYKAEILKDPGVKMAYDELEPEFEVIASLIRLRLKRGMSQKELAGAIGTKQPAIARLESGCIHGVSLTTLAKIAKALKARLKVELVAIEEAG